VDPRSKALERVQRLTLDENHNRPYEWTADGTALLYISDREGEFHIFRHRLGAAAPEIVVDGHDNPNIMRLSPDGRQILYLSELSRAGHGGPPVAHTSGFDQEKVRVMSAPSSGGAGSLLLEADGINNFQCARAPATLCLLSRFTKDALLFVQFDPLTGASKDFFRTSDPRWQHYNWTLSPDGKLLALCKYEERVALDTKIRLISTGDGSERTVVVNDWVGIHAIDWAADGKSFWASATLRGETGALINIDMQGNFRAVLQDGKPYVGWGIQSRDGKQIAIWQATGGSNVWMLEGF